MNARVEPLRVGLAVVTILGLVVAMMMVFTGPARATHVDPTFIAGNQNCNAVTGLVELTKFEPISDGEKTQDGVTIVVDGDTFNWTSTVEIAAVFVKGGDDGNLYDYRPDGAFEDTGLHAPVNPNNDKFFGLSHITFCIPDPSTTTTTTTVAETTTTVADTTTTTVADTTTTTVADTTTTSIEDEVLGTVITTTTIVDEVLDTNVEAEELPFTGIDSDQLVGMAVLLLAGGLVLLGVTGRREEG